MFFKTFADTEDSATPVDSKKNNFSPESIANYIYHTDTENGRKDTEVELRAKTQQRLKELFGAELLKNKAGRQRLDELTAAIVPILQKKEEYDIAIDDSRPVSKDSVALAEDIVTKLRDESITGIWSDPFSNKHIDSIIEEALGPICKSENPTVKNYVHTLRNDTRKEVIRKLTTDGNIAIAQDVIVDVARQTFEPIQKNLQQRNAQKAAVLSAFTGLFALGYSSFAPTINAAVTVGAVALNLVTVVIAGWALLNIANSINKARLNRQFAKAAVASLSKLMTRAADFKVLLTYISTNLNNRYGYLVEKNIKTSIEASLKKYAHRDWEILQFPLILERAIRKQWSGKQFYEYLKQHAFELTMYTFDIQPSSHIVNADYLQHLKERMPVVLEKIANENKANRRHAKELLVILQTTLSVDGGTYNLLSMLADTINANIVPMVERIQKDDASKKQ